MLIIIKVFSFYLSETSKDFADDITGTELSIV